MSLLSRMFRLPIREYYFTLFYYAKEAVRPKVFKLVIEDVSLRSAYSFALEMWDIDPNPEIVDIINLGKNEKGVYEYEIREL